MNKTLKIISVWVLVLSVCALVFSSCSINDKEDESTTTTVRSTDYTYSDEPITMQKQTEFVHETLPVPTEREKVEQEDVVQTAPSAKTETTKKAVSGGNVDEIQNGVNLVTRTTPVIKGNAATIMIQGTPGAEYSIEYYENGGTVASGEDFHNVTADSMGFASWTFRTSDSCESGEKKVIIRELNSDKYIQTSITVE